MEQEERDRPPRRRDRDRRASVLIGTALIVAAILMVVVVAGAFRIADSRQAAADHQQDRHDQLIDARAAFDAISGPPPPSPPPGLGNLPALPPPPLTLARDLEGLLQALQEIADSGSAEASQSAREAIEPLEGLSFALVPTEAQSSDERLRAWAELRRTIGTASGRLDRLIDVQHQELAASRASAAGTMRSAVLGIGGIAMLIFGVIALVWFRAIRVHHQGVAALEASAMRLAGLATTDSLTGLANQREFNLRLDAEVERARRHGRPLTLILLDLDHFKFVNDAHGHQVGDAVLAETAARLAGLARMGETIARIGGEEFAWLVPETTRLDGYMAAERARREISRLPYSEAGWLTISCGVAQLEDAESAAVLIRHADSALYWAKNHGRDTTFTYSDQVARELSENAHGGDHGHEQTLSALRSLAQAIDAKHPGTRDHSRRVAQIAGVIARRLDWPSKDALRIRDAALVHDVGMIHVPDRVFLKPGPMDESDRRAIEEHPTAAAGLVSEVLDSEQTSWVEHHHERWDGQGYPSGASGDAIPVGAQILAVAEAWDAMRHERPHRASLEAGAALGEIRSQSGDAFSPRVVDALVEAHESGELPEAVDAESIVD